MEVYIFLGLVGLARLITGIVLLRLSAQRNLPNLKWLAWGFIATVVDIPFTAQPYVPFIDKAITYFVYLCFAVFIVRTFYQGKRSPFTVFWTVFTALYVILFWATGQFLTQTTGVGFPQNIFIARPDYAAVPTERFETIDSVIYGFLQIAIWLWHAIAGFQASQSIRNDEAVEDWIKSRYNLIVAYSVLQSLIGVVMMIRPFSSPALVSASALLVFITTTMQFLVWVMPEWFRKWLNRNQQARTAQRIHEQVVGMFNIIGTAMSDGTGLPSMLSVYVLRKAISNQIGTEDSKAVEEHALKLGYKEWLAVLQDPEFYILVKNSGADVTARDVVEKAKQVLSEKQSLFTMQAR